MWARARGWVPSPSDSPPRRVSPRQGWPRLGRAHTRVPVSLSHSFQKRNTHPKERNVSEQRMCVFTSSCSNPILRENPQSSSLARQNFCGKLSKTFPLPGAGSLGGRPHRAGVRRCSSEAPEGESAVAHREEGRGGPPPDRSDQRRKASFLFWRTLEPSRPPACLVARRTERPPLGVCLLSRARLRRGAAKMTVSRTSKMLNYINFREFRWPRDPPSLHPPHTHSPRLVD